MDRYFLTRNKKSVYSVIGIFILMCFIMLAVLNCNTVYAQENENEVYQESSLLCNVIANKREIGTARITSYIHLKPSGDGMFSVKAHIEPKTNDGLNDYIVRKFSLEVALREQKDNISDVTYADNSTEKIEEIVNGTSITSTSDGKVSFTISHTSTIVADVTAVNAKYNNREGIIGTGEVDKFIEVSTLNPDENRNFEYCIVFFFKFDPTKSCQFDYGVVLESLYIEGVFLAPDYEEDNNETLVLGACANLNNEFDNVGFIYHTDKNDGRSDDKFTQKSYANRNSSQS